MTNMMACEKDSCKVKVCSIAGLSNVYTCIFLARSLLKGGGGGGAINKSMNDFKGTTVK